jgi:hypothetical protein
MRVSVGLFLVVGLLAAGCKKSDDPPGDSQAIGSDNGPALGEGTPQNAATPTQGVVTPTRVAQPVQPIRPAFAPIGATPGAAANVPAPPVVAAPPASPVAATPAKATPAAATPPAGAVAAGRGVPPPPGGRPKPGTK